MYNSRIYTLSTKQVFLILSIILLSFNCSFAQQIMVKKPNGNEIDLNEVAKGDKDQIVIIYTWQKDACQPCVRDLVEFNESHNELKQKYNIKFVALNLDMKYTHDEIMNYTKEKGWTFDIYTDKEGNYLDVTQQKYTPHKYMFVNSIVEMSYEGGFGDFLVEIIENAYSNILYFDDDWKFTNKKFASFIRYRDKIGDYYDVTDRWITGEKQMTGKFSDFWCHTKEGDFTWYKKDGSVASRSTYKNGVKIESDKEVVIEEIVEDEVEKLTFGEQIVNEATALGLEELEPIPFNRAAIYYKEDVLQLRMFFYRKDAFIKKGDKYYYIFPFDVPEAKIASFILPISKFWSTWSIYNSKGETVVKSFKQVGKTTTHKVKYSKDGEWKNTNGIDYIIQGGTEQLNQPLMKSGTNYLALIFNEEQYKTVIKEGKVSIGFLGFYLFNKQYEHKEMKQLILDLKQ